MSTNNTDIGSTGKEKGSGMGSKMRGAAQVAHGVGEVIRGTVLGAIDNIAGDDRTMNREIAAQGRMEYSQGMAKMRGAGTGATAGYGNGGGFGTSTGVGTGAAGVETNQYGEAGGAGAGGPGGAYDAKRAPEAADTQHIQPGAYTPAGGHQQKQPMAPTNHTGTGTGGGTGQNYDTGAQTGSAGDEVGGPGGGYEANKTSESNVADMKQSDQYNQQQSADSRYEEPILSTGVHDTRPNGEFQQK